MKLLQLVLRILGDLLQLLTRKSRQEKKIEKRYREKLREIDEAIVGKKDISLLTSDFLSRDDQPIRVPQDGSEGDRDGKQGG